MANTTNAACKGWNEPQVLSQIIEKYREEVSDLDGEVKCLQQKLQIMDHLHRAEVEYWKNEIRTRDEKILSLEESVKQYESIYFDYADYFCHYQYQRSRFELKRIETMVTNCHKNLLNSVIKRNQESIRLLTEEKDILTKQLQKPERVEQQSTENDRRYVELEQEIIRLKKQLEDKTQELKESQHLRFSTINSPLFSPSPILQVNYKALESPGDALMAKNLDLFAGIKNCTPLLLPNTATENPSISEKTLSSPIVKDTPKSSSVTNRDLEEVKNIPITDSPQLSSAKQISSVNCAIRRLNFQNDRHSTTDVVESIPIPHGDSSCHQKTELPNNSSHENDTLSNNNASNQVVVRSTSKNPRRSSNFGNAMIKKQQLTKNNLSNLLKESPMGLPSSLNNKKKRSSFNVLARYMLFFWQ